MVTSPASFFSTPPAAHMGACKALRSSGTANHSGASGEACVALMVISLHPFRRRNAQQFESVGQHLTGGVIQPQARAVNVLHGFIALRRDAASVVPAVVAPAMTSRWRATRCGSRSSAAFATIDG